MLYWFRTPPGVRVGRAALDEDAIRLIEEHNPEIDFDWTQILRGVPEPPAEPQPQPAGRTKGRRQAADRPREETPPAVELASTIDVGPEDSPDRAMDEVSEAGEAEPLSLSATLDEYDATLAGGDPASAGGIDDYAVEETPPAAAAVRLGPEGLLRLRARYAEILARISEKVADPVRQEQLKAQAERLNPDTWVTDQEVRDGLEQYEAVFESLRAVVGRGRSRYGRRRAARTDRP